MPSTAMLLRTLRNPTTIGWFAGSAIIYALFWLAHVLDSAGTPNFSHLRGVLFVAHATIVPFYANYKLISGQWTLNNWTRRLHWIVNFPSYSLMGWFCASVPLYWPAGLFIYSSSAVTYLGLYRFYEFTLPNLLFNIAFLLSMYLVEPATLAVNWPFILLVMAGHYTYMFFIGLGSERMRRQNNTTTRLLRASRRDKRTIAEERKKSEGLLLNILPEKVAEELKQKGANRPVHFDSATVLFTDFQGFTRIAEHMAPGELIQELDRCFSYFDSLMDRHRLEKLKTIGDSFMCAGGLPEPNRTHAVDCVLAALEIQAFMNQMRDIKTEQGLPYWSLRVGIHSGPLVAGVIGEKKFAYDVWGDTVNTASRCESAGEAGRINVSTETRALIEPFFECEYRGRVPAKNKGEIEMYFVNGLRPELQRSGEPRIPNEQFQAKYAALS